MVCISHSIADVIVRMGNSQCNFAATAPQSPFGHTLQSMSLASTQPGPGKPLSGISSPRIPV